MALLKRKVNGSTMVEVLVSMVIILTCLGIAMVIFTNLSRDVNDELLIQAEVRVSTFAVETKGRHDFADVTLEFENMKIQRTILPHPQKERLKILLIEAVTPLGKKITEYREIVSIDLEKE